MSAALAYAAVALLLLSVVLTRAARRQLATARKRLGEEETATLEAGRELQVVLRELHDAEQRLAGLDGRMREAEAAVEDAQRALDAARQTPDERYHVLDRSEPARNGAVWAVEVARPAEAAPAGPWSGVRVYLVAAASQGEALERVVHRFPRAAGYEVGRAAPWPPATAPGFPGGAGRPTFRA